MSSIFDLKTSTNELSSANAGTSRMLYEQHPCTRDITGNNFPNGAQHFRFECAGQKWWIPARSYMRLRYTLLDGNGDQLEIEDGIGPNMFTMSNLYQSGEFRIADKTVSRVSDYMAQVDALESRVNKSKSWLDSVCRASNNSEADAIERINKVSSDGYKLKAQSGLVPVQSATNILNLKSLNRADIGLDPLNNLAFANGANTVTFAANGGAAPLIDQKLKCGDIIVFPIAINNLNANTPVTVVNIDSPTVIQISHTFAADVGAAVVDFDVYYRNTEDSRGISSQELIYQPPMSIFKIGHALPSGKYELVLNPQTAQAYQKRFIESILADKAPGAGQDFQLNIVDCFLYIATVDGPRADDLTYLIDLEETRCQVNTVNGASTGLQQQNFDVSPSTYALTMAFQDERAGQLTQYSASKLKVQNDVELNLVRAYLNYAGQNKPQPDADPQYSVGDAVDYTTQRYADSLLHTGGYFDSGGAEEIEEWQDRGAYYYFSWPRDGTDRSTRVNTNFQFNPAAPNSRVLLFDHYKAVARVQVSDGRVVDVQVEDA